jgi:hypothetical protein
MVMTNSFMEYIGIITDVQIRLMIAGAWLTTPEDSLCVVNDQPVGNPKRKI